jgi:hypothetical protein
MTGIHNGGLLNTRYHRLLKHGFLF